MEMVKFPMFYLVRNGSIKALTYCSKICVHKGTISILLYGNPLRYNAKNCIFEAIEYSLPEVNHAVESDNDLASLCKNTTCMSYTNDENCKKALTTIYLLDEDFYQDHNNSNVIVVSKLCDTSNKLAYVYAQAQDEFDKRRYSLTLLLHGSPFEKPQKISKILLKGSVPQYITLRVFNVVEPKNLSFLDYIPYQLVFTGFGVYEKVEEGNFFKIVKTRGFTSRTLLASTIVLDEKPKRRQIPTPLPTNVSGSLVERGSSKGLIRLSTGLDSPTVFIGNSLAIGLIFENLDDLYKSLKDSFRTFVEDSLGALHDLLEDDEENFHVRMRSLRERLRHDVATFDMRYFLKSLVHYLMGSISLGNGNLWNVAWYERYFNMELDDVKAILSSFLRKVGYGEVDIQNMRLGSIILKMNFDIKIKKSKSHGKLFEILKFYDLLNGYFQMKKNKIRLDEWERAALRKVLLLISVALVSKGIKPGAKLDETLMSHTKDVLKELLRESLTIAERLSAATIEMGLHALSHALMSFLIEKTGYSDVTEIVIVEGPWSKSFATLLDGFFLRVPGDYVKGAIFAISYTSGSGELFERFRIKLDEFMSYVNSILYLNGLDRCYEYWFQRRTALKRASAIRGYGVNEAKYSSIPIVRSLMPYNLRSVDEVISYLSIDTENAKELISIVYGKSKRADKQYLLELSTPDCFDGCEACIGMHGSCAVSSPLPKMWTYSKKALEILLKDVITHNG
ncbi:hypothetical protein IPA_03235 [Ignicoccus pacificus DSM 13166]|uniref:Uncharacterized protein n=1 Tax=Ignicoccus pacificus DSM 13166 TaxID=940294 RepID=A0A977KBW8_9CREN|nr:hypothetical protein IPA_03235 [Ignicoccus pacificus DSM 13166]